MAKTLADFKAAFPVFFANNVLETSTDKMFDRDYAIVNGFLIVYREYTVFGQGSSTVYKVYAPTMTPQGRKLMFENKYFLLSSAIEFASTHETETF